MKKAVLLYLVLFVVSFVVFGCGDDDDPDCYIRFFVEGEEVVLRGGFTDPGYGGCPGVAYISNYGTYGYAYLASYTTNQDPNTNYCTIAFEGSSAGVYTETNAQLRYRGTNKRYSKSVTLNLTVDSYGGVGGLISGTFSGVISNTNLGVQQVSNGSFILKRLKDNDPRFD